jgi:predicted phage-related endonuclease
MPKILRETRFKDRTPEWYEFRKTCIGASSVGVIMGLSKYTTAAEEFQKKSGFINEPHDSNKFTHFGIHMEDVIAKEYWRYYDPSNPEELYNNHVHG